MLFIGGLRQSGSQSASACRDHGQKSLLSAPVQTVFISRQMLRHTFGHTHRGSQQFLLASSAFAIASPSQIRGDRWRRREGRHPSVEPERRSKRTKITHRFSGRAVILLFCYSVILFTSIKLFVGAITSVKTTLRRMHPLRYCKRLFAICGVFLFVFLLPQYIRGERDHQAARDLNPGPMIGGMCELLSIPYISGQSMSPLLMHLADLFSGQRSFRRRQRHQPTFTTQIADLEPRRLLT